MNNTGRDWLLYGGISSGVIGITLWLTWAWLPIWTPEWVASNSPFMNQLINRNLIIHQTDTISKRLSNDFNSDEIKHTLYKMIIKETEYDVKGKMLRILSDMKDTPEAIVNDVIETRYLTADDDIELNRFLQLVINNETEKIILNRGATLFLLNHSNKNIGNFFWHILTQDNFTSEFTENELLGMFDADLPDKSIRLIHWYEATKSPLKNTTFVDIINQGVNAVSNEEIKTASLIAICQIDPKLSTFNDTLVHHLNTTDSLNPEVAAYIETMDENSPSLISALSKYAYRHATNKSELPTIRRLLSSPLGPNIKNEIENKSSIYPKGWNKISPHL